MCVCGGALPCAKAPFLCVRRTAHSCSGPREMRTDQGLVTLNRGGRGQWQGTVYKLKDVPNDDRFWHKFEEAVNPWFNTEDP
jgi:uncharacterized protein (DUF2147 family)